MERTSLYDFVFFGTSCRYLVDVRAPASYTASGCVGYNIQSVFKFLNENKMKVSMNAARDLYSLSKEFDAKYSEGENEHMTEEDIERVNVAMEVLRPTILAEAEEINAFFAKEKRYNIDLLYDNPADIFGASVFYELPESAQMDFGEGLKCIVLERGTAAAYHLMRGSEATLKQLYLSIVKQKRLAKPMWGPMVSKLEERGVLDDALKGTLENARRGFRNPVAHPDRFYSVDEAQDILGTTTQLVSLIVSHEKYTR
ncbi:hypothetical protein [Tateyamaria sp.]|uniref:hypothetical protein n=1 Tax=Tateyamaria sp. TaxID=1929288 RepID=UPI00329C1430